jgi:hypothetical protein
MAEIAAASDQQTQGLDQITTAVAQMDQVTQQNAANSEESASAAEELSSQAQEMQAMVASFKLSTDGRGAKPTSYATSSAQQARPAQKKKPTRELVGTAPKRKNGSDHPSSIIPLDDDSSTLQDF